MAIPQEEAISHEAALARSATECRSPTSNDFSRTSMISLDGLESPSLNGWFQGKPIVTHLDLAQAKSETLHGIAQAQSISSPRSSIGDEIQCAPAVASAAPTVSSPPNSPNPAAQGEVK